MFFAPGEAAKINLYFFYIFTVCPHGITNITGEISGEIEYPSSGTYGANETKCWRIEVPKPYSGIKIIYHR